MLRVRAGAEGPRRASGGGAEKGLCRGQQGRALRRFPPAGEEGGSVATQAGVSKEPKKERKPRVDQAELPRRTFAWDVFTCACCGGKRRVWAYLMAPGGVRAILEHLGLPSWPAQHGPHPSYTPDAQYGAQPGKGTTP
jgi:hypothetical protein